MESESDQASTSNLQEIQKTEEHVKPCLVDAINKFQTVGNCRSHNQVSSTNKVQGKEKMEGDPVH